MRKATEFLFRVIGSLIVENRVDLVDLPSGIVLRTEQRDRMESVSNKI